MGIWSACFDGFIHPSDTRAYVWTGCYWIFNWDFWNRGIWSWLNPYWLIGVQVLCGLAFICHCISALVMLLYFVLCGMRVAEAGAAMVCQWMAAVLMFIAVVVFGAKSDDRLWMARPDHNHLSWSYAFAVLSCFVSIISAVFLTIVFKSDSRLESEYEYMERYGNQMGPPVEAPGAGGPYSPQAYGYAGQDEQLQYANLQHGPASPYYSEYGAGPGQPSYGYPVAAEQDSYRQPSAYDSMAGGYKT